MPKDSGHHIRIPWAVYVDPVLSAEAKLLYGEIWLRSRQRGYCFSLNAALCQSLNCAERSVQRYLSDLQNAGHLRLEMAKTEQGFQRRLFITDPPPPLSPPTPATAVTPMPLSPPANSVVSPPATAVTNIKNIRELEEIREVTNVTSPAVLVKPAAHKRPAPKRPPRSRRAPPDPSWQRWVDAWFDFFKPRHEGRDPNFNGTEGKALKQLRKYLVKVSKPGPGPPDDQGFATWTYLLTHWDRLDEWQVKQFDLTVVLKKINDFLNQLKNGTHRKPNTFSPGTGPQGISAERIAALQKF